MLKQVNKQKNVFFTCTIHLSNWPDNIITKWDPVSLHNQDEAIEKMHRFCHSIYNVPITWICSYSALQKYSEKLTRFHHDYNDEIGIMEYGIMPGIFLGHQAEEYQDWVEKCGLVREDLYTSKELDMPEGFKGWADMSYEEQKTGISYLKNYFDDILKQNTKTFATPYINQDTIKVMAEVGLEVSWGYNWNYFCEGINNKGCLFYPFYISEKNHNVPECNPGEKSVLAVHWGVPTLIGYNADVYSRKGMSAYCLNSMELVNRSEGYDKFRYHEKIIHEWIEQSKWNPYVHLPLQLEAIWLDEGEMEPERYEQFPAFYSRTAENFYSQIETALRLGAKPLTISGFSEWHKENMKDTAEMIYCLDDLLPELRSIGKDQSYQPMVIFGEKKHQYIFLKSRGFNYVRKYVYEPLTEEKDVEFEYPFEAEPKVYLKIKTYENMKAGVIVTPQKAYYELNEFNLTAYNDNTNYAAILWEANIPSYVTDADIETGGSITGFRTIREKNIAILLANLKKGFNNMIFRSELPNRYIRIKTVEKIGHRYEIWIENNNAEVLLHTLRVNLEPNLKIGGFWWDGYYNHSIFRYGFGTYDRVSGILEIKIMYPNTLKIGSGLTRVSIELF